MNEHSECDLVVRGVVDATGDHETVLDIGIRHDEIVAIEPQGALSAPYVDEYDGAFVLPGLIEIAEGAPRADFLEAEFGPSQGKRGIVACGVLDHDGETVDLLRLSSVVPQRIVRVASLPRADRFDELFSAAQPTALFAWEIGSGRSDALAWPEIEAAVHVAARKDLLVVARPSGDDDQECARVNRWLHLAEASGARIHLTEAIFSGVADLVAGACEDGASVTVSWSPWANGIADPHDSMDNLDIEDGLLMLEAGAFDCLNLPRARGGSHDPFVELITFARGFGIDFATLVCAGSIRPSEILGFPIAPSLAIGSRPEFVVFDAERGTRLATYCGRKI